MADSDAPTNGLGPMTGHVPKTGLGPMMVDAADLAASMKCPASSTAVDTVEISAAVVDDWKAVLDVLTAAAD